MTGTRLWSTARIPADLSSPRLLRKAPPLRHLQSSPRSPGGGIWATPGVPGCQPDSGLVSPSTVPRLGPIFPNLHHRLAITCALAAGDAALANGTPSSSKHKWRATRSKSPSFAQMPQSLGHPHQHHPLQDPEVLQRLISTGQLMKTFTLPPQAPGN